MSMKRYENIKVLVAEPGAGLRREIKATLVKAGFTDIVDTGNLGVVVNTIEKGDIDLLIGDTKMPEGDLSEVVYDVRHGDLGDNPFLVTITLVSDASKEILKEVVDSGTDSVLVKPFAPEDLSDRIDALAQFRKRFVVTSDYIGPDRRGKNRNKGEEIMLITVPNPLRDKSFGYNGQLRNKKAIETAMKFVNDQKIERYAVQMNWLIEKITPNFVPLGDAETFSLDQEAVGCLMRLSAVANDFSCRLNKSRFLLLSEMSITLKNVSNAMMANADEITTQDLVTISKLGKIIQNTVERDKSTPDEMKSTVDDAAGPE